MIVVMSLMSVAVIAAMQMVTMGGSLQTVLMARQAVFACWRV